MFSELTSLSETARFLNWNAFLFLLLTLVLLALAKKANDRLVKYNLDEELTQKDNKAVAISFSGFILAIGLVLQGTLDMPTHSGYLVEDSLKIAVWGLLSSLFLLLSRFINDRFILGKFSNQEELADKQNIGVGVVQAGGYLSSALMLRGAMLGQDAETLLQEILICSLWFIITQVLLVTYTLVYKKLSGSTLQTALSRGNSAVGVSLAGSLISFGILIAFYLINFESIIGLVIWLVMAIILLKLVSFIVDKIFLPAHSLKDELRRDNNWGAALIDAVTSIITALILTGSLF